MDEAIGTGMQVLGLCRFSVPSLGGFQVEHVTLEARRAMLYDPSRLDLRTVWFEHVTLPSIRAQRDRNFTFVVMVGEDLPDPWRSRLERMIADVPQVRIVAAPPGQHRRICADAVRAHVDPAADCVAEFRLDDDDAVAVDYVAQLRRNWPRLARLAGPNGRVALDHGKGVVIEGRADGRVDLHPLNTLCWSAGLALYVRPDDPGIIMDFPHHKIWSRVPYVNLTDSLMFIRGDHGTNDAKTPFAAGVPIPMEEADLAEALSRRFAIDIAAFRAEWAALCGPT